MSPPRVEAVRDFGTLAPLAGAWRALERADGEGHAFLSWPWMWGRLRALHASWEVLVVRAGAPARTIGILPLRALGRRGAWGMAGSPLADFTGLLCAPGREEEVIDALVGHLARTADRGPLELADVHDRRVEELLARLGAEGCVVDSERGVACPVLELEDDWDRLLASRLSASRRATVRRKLRRFERLPDLRVTDLEAGGATAIDALLELWQGRWGRLDADELRQYRSVFDACRRAGSLWLEVFWQGDVPITGLLAFLDRRRSWFGFYLTGFDPRYAAFSPGTVAVAHSLRRAIAEGYRTYDFLRGDEPYKRSFGARPRYGVDACVGGWGRRRGLTNSRQPVDRTTA